MKLLVIEPRTLFPMDKGAKILSGNVIAELAREHEVTVLVNVDPEEPSENTDQMRGLGCNVVPVAWREVPNFTARFYLELARCLLTGQLYAVKKYCTAALKERAEELARSGAFDVVVCDTISASMPDVDFGPLPCVVISHNIEHRLRERQAARAGGLKAAYLRHYARKTRKFEVRSYRAADHVAAVSPVDAEFIRDDLGVAHVTALPPGVDTEYFSPQGAESPWPEIVFTGSMDWQSNQDAVCFFAEQVLPSIRESVPDVRFTVVGRRPPPHITRLAEADPDHITVTGTVPDVRPYLARGWVAAVPVLFGSGIKIKVFEAMAMAKPVVVSTIGAEGLPLTNGVDSFVVDGPKDMAAACVKLLSDKDLRNRIGDRARRTVLDGHDWAAVAAKLADICKSVTAGGRV